MRVLVSLFKKWPLHTLLLPFFFLVHNYLYYYGLVTFGEVVEVSLIILLLFSLLVFIAWLATGALNKAFLITTIIGIAVLFFGDLKDVLENTLLAFLGRYLVLLPALVIIIVLIYRAIVTGNKLNKANLFLNLFFLLSLFADGIRILYKEKNALLQKNLMVKADARYEIQPKSQRPDVYYLLFDSYPGSGMLKKYMQFDNSPFENALNDAGFRVLQQPSSNYNRTVFSMASLLNYQYPKDGSDFSPIGARDYNEALLTIKNAAVPVMFKRAGYDLFNLSIFSFNGASAIREESFLNLPGKTMLTYSSLPVRIKKDLGWIFITGKYASGLTRKIFGSDKMTFKQHDIEKKEFNSKVYDSLQMIPGKIIGRPRFVYCHFYMPHPPFFYDEQGNSINMDKAVNDVMLKDKNEFIAYLRYTNKVILNIVDKIRSMTGNQAVVIIQSDHGFTDFEGRPPEIETVFQNFSAFYFPDRDYSGLYDTMSNVNTFPVFFNKYFESGIRLKEDRSIFLSY